jgi:4-hydroxy-3-methylbut-2-enyl diphosphate reductase
VICQSTTSPVVAQEVLAEIYAKNPGKPILFVPTFCGPTRKRQAAISNLLHKVEAVVVIGGKNSNNTKELVRLATSRGIACLHIQSAVDLDPEWFEPYETVGLTAGTSTPDETIDAVYRELVRIAFERDRVALVNV